MRAAYILIALFIPALISSGCECSCSTETDGDADSDSDTDVDADTGNDADHDDGADADDETEGLSFDYFVFEETEEGEAGDPIEGVLIAVDSPDGREIFTTDGSGRAAVEISGDPEWITFTLAIEGYALFTHYRMTTEDIEEWLDLDGHIETLMWPLAGPATDSIEVLVYAVGAPDGSTFCSSAEPFYLTCGDTRDIARFYVESTSDPVPALGFVIDKNGEFTEIEVAETENGLEDQSVELIFDGSTEVTSQNQPFTILLPEDEESLFTTVGTYTDQLLPVFVMEPGTYLVRGGATGHVYDDKELSLDMDVDWFPLTGEDLLFGIALYVDEDFDRYTYAWFSQGLSVDPYEIIDIPRISSPDPDGNLSSQFSWQSIQGADQYGMMISDDEIETILWMVFSDHDHEITLPDLPDGYDPSNDWPSDLLGGFWIYAWQNPYAEGDPDEPLRIDQQESTSEFVDLELSF